MTIVPSISLTLHWVVTFGPLGVPLPAVALGCSSCSFGCVPAFILLKSLIYCKKIKKKCQLHWAVVVAHWSVSSSFLVHWFE